ncbi:signal recognition particle-docking protein FtsY [Leptolyngbya sp. FACHB-36]|uniref:signal recognition particle-docking protein FtsY n=1 Tax=Leptolyngbya sp. FACHB-36 TaxID=2692808 RepID=UPI0016805390|nr:signal recognition particle-docking protein FtsY [Leptolyngbya sp. FACHB-36]MBD2021354.1 signal recognition particle-docking protein FtsY [Leptolyngbya sp. FACHB-36]
MTFDWFRRKFDQKPAEAQTAPEPAPAEPETPPEEAPEEATPAVAEDYLSFAKAAYETIRKRQQEQEPADDTALPAEAVATPDMPAAIESTDAPVAEPAVVAAVPDAMQPETTEPAAAEADPIVEAPAAPLPFWAKSETERLERLERLKETAIVEPEPEAAPVVAVEPVAAVDAPDLMLDEGFVWSTEVLAAQGRRAEDISIEEITWLKRLRQGLDKTRRGLVNQLRAIVGQGPLNQDAVLEIEAALLQADVGVAATDAIIEALQTKLRNETLPPDAAITYLKQILRDMLDAPLKDEASRFFAPQKDTLNIWLITGVNGAGKTTTIGKLAHIAKKSGYNCLIAAADTFRAAAVEQVKVWGKRSDVEVIANPGQNTDPAAVVFDAITAAQARSTELLLVDTAGRLQNKKNLMDELSKVRRIIDKKADSAVVESLLVLDSTLGQNGLRQAEVFSQAAQLSGVVLTKLDGTAKGGIALAVVQQLGLPIRFIGAGEGIEDLRPFSSYEFVEALLNG